MEHQMLHRELHHHQQQQHGQNRLSFYSPSPPHHLQQSINGLSDHQHKVFGNPIGGLNLSHSGSGLSHPLSDPSSYPHHPLMLPMSMVSPPEDLKVKRNDHHPSPQQHHSQQQHISPSQPQQQQRQSLQQPQRHSTSQSSPSSVSSSGTDIGGADSPPASSWSQVYYNSGNVQYESSKSSKGKGAKNGAGVIGPRLVIKPSDMTSHPQNNVVVFQETRRGRRSLKEGTDEDIRPFTCELCPKRFAQKAGLIQHERRHSGERPFPCSVCDKRFTQKSGLVQHERLHSGEKPYECPECDKKFTQKSGLVQHVRTHTGERPYKCQVCGKCFTQLSGLKQHGKVHSK